MKNTFYSGNFFGPFLLILAMFMFAAMGIFVKSAGKHVPFVEIVMFRCLASAAAVWLLAKREKISVRGTRRDLLFLRALFGTIGLFMYFYAMTKIPIGDTILLNQTAPVFILPLAVLFLKEKVTKVHVFLVAVVLLGVVLVIKPTGNVVNAPALIALGSAVFTAFAYILIRRLTSIEHPLTIVFWFNAIGFLVSLPITIPVFILPGLGDALDLAVMALLATFGQILMTFAYRYSEAGRLSALGSFGAVFGAFFDYAVTGHLPDIWSALGSITIIVSCFLLQLNGLGQRNLIKDRFTLS